MKNEFPTISKAVSNLSALDKAKLSGAVEIDFMKHIWKFRNKFVTEAFLEDLFK